MAAKKNLISTDLLLYGGLIAGAYFVIIRPILTKLGVQDTAREKAIDTTKPANNPWAGNGFLNAYKGKNYALLTESAKQTLSKQIYNALPDFGNDDSSLIFGIFRNLKTRSQVADLAQYFLKNYGYDLFNFLKQGRTKSFFWSSTTSGLNSSNLNTVIQIVNAKPLLYP